MIAILVTILVFVLVAYFLRLVLPSLGIPEPFVTGVIVLLAIILIIYLFGGLGVFPRGLA
jgi:hypothetical protein